MHAMTPYGAGNSGITAYAVGKDFIVVQFKSGDRYRYDHETPGPAHVTAMKQHAASGRGLATYISQHVGANYAEKLR
jgi:hypothetical protein